MTIDQHARASAAQLNTHLDRITVPEPSGVARRARRRRAGAVAAVFVVAAAVLVPVALLARGGDSPDRVEIAGPREDARLPAGSTVEGAWTMIPKESAGIAGTTLHALASDGDMLLLGGERPDGARQSVTMWRSDDGLNWDEAVHPTAHDSITAIGIHNGTALAIGAPGGPSAFVWRSVDGGRRWEEIARGEIFGAPLPDNRPGPFVSTLLWHDGWWVAAGGAADGYEAIWISRDGSEWEIVLNSRTSGSIDGVVQTPDGSLMAYGVGATESPSAVAVGWFTNDPTRWSDAVPLVTPDRFYLRSVTRGATIAVGESIDVASLTAVLRSTDGGHTWTEDVSFPLAFPDARAISAARVGGRDVIVGTTAPTTGETSPPRAWLFSKTAGWITIPSSLAGPTPPTSAVPQRPPRGSLSLVSSVAGRIVMLGSDAGLDRFYVYDSDGPVAAEARTGDPARGPVP